MLTQMDLTCNYTTAQLDSEIFRWQLEWGGDTMCYEEKVALDDGETGEDWMPING